MCEPEKSLLSLSHMRHLLLSKCIQCLNIDEIIIAITQSSLLAKRTVTFSFLSQDYFNNISVDIWCLILIMSKRFTTNWYHNIHWFWTLCVRIWEGEGGGGWGGGIGGKNTHSLELLMVCSSFRAKPNLSRFPTDTKHKQHSSCYTTYPILKRIFCLLDTHSKHGWHFVFTSH